MLQPGGIEQHGVFAQDPTASPAQFKEQIQIGLVHGLGRADMNRVVSARPGDEFKAKLVEQRIEFEIGLLESGSTGQTDLKRPGLIAIHRRNVDVGVKRLPQRRVDCQSPQSGSIRARCVGGAGHGGRDHCDPRYGHETGPRGTGNTWDLKTLAWHDRRGFRSGAVNSVQM